MSCKGCYTCKHTRLDPNEEPCITCEYSGNAKGYEDNWEPKEPPTNAERIRMMSDEELAAIVMCPYDGLTDEYCEKVDCVKCCLEWLKKREGV